MPPLKKGAYCFATVLQLSVGRSVDQVLSVQYLLTHSLDQWQTWCRGCPQWLDDPYWFSGHMFKGQGQTILSPLCCLLNITLLITNLVQGLPSVSRNNLIFKWSMDLINKKWFMVISEDIIKRSRTQWHPRMKLFVGNPVLICMI